MEKKIEKTELEVLNDFLITLGKSRISIRKKLVILDKFVEKFKNGHK